MAIINGVTKHHQYLYGRHFIIKTDHKPLTFIYGPKFGLSQTAASRLQRYATKLASYDYGIQFVKSQDNGNVDALSRLPLPREHKLCNGLDSVSYLNYVEESFPISSREVAAATQKDDVLKQITNYVLNGWPSVVTSDDEKPYFYRKDQIAIEKGCLLYRYSISR